MDKYVKVMTWSAIPTRVTMGQLALKKSAWDLHVNARTVSTVAPASWPHLVSVATTKMTVSDIPRASSLAP
jgi:hypothetical protein